MSLRNLRYVWLSFGRMLDIAPRQTNAGRNIRRMQRELAQRSDAAAIGNDYRQVSFYIRSAMEKFNG